MEIRLGTSADLNACIEIDDSFETDYVWQMEEQNRAGDIAVNFRLTHLPRPMKIYHAISNEQMRAEYERGGTLVIAEQGGLRGFVQVARSDLNRTLVICQLAVAPLYRRQGIASKLVRAGLEWGRQQKLRVALLDTSTKNNPAISFFQKQGFQFCGFNDKLYLNRDIALYFSLLIH